MAVDRVVVAHQHQGRVRIAAPEAGSELDDALQRGSRLERAVSGRLDGWPVRHGIAERHAELDNVDSGGRKAGQDSRRGLEIGIAAGDEGDEAGAALGFQLGKAAADAALGGLLANRGLDGAHSDTPNRSATANMSLSPRPQRFMSSR